MNRTFGRSAGPRLSPEEADRQGRVSRHALSLLPPQDAIAFLNGHDEGTQGSRLDVAVKSTDGFAAVMRALDALNADRNSGSND